MFMYLNIFNIKMVVQSVQKGSNESIEKSIIHDCVNLYPYTITVSNSITISLHFCDDTAFSSAHSSHPRCNRSDDIFGSVEKTGNII